MKSKRHTTIIIYTHNRSCVYIYVYTNMYWLIGDVFIGIEHFIQKYTVGLAPL